MALKVANQKNIQSILGLEAPEAKELARALKEAAGSPEAVDAVLDKTSTRLDGFGVEVVNGDYQVDRYYFSIVLLYINRGDTYDDTLLYETDTEKFYVGSWGDWAEAKGARYRVL